jgi:hypothetical protein
MSLVNSLFIQLFFCGFISGFLKRENVFENGAENDEGDFFENNKKCKRNVDQI